MKQYDVKCPLCGTVNKDLFLEETDGYMVCEHCEQTVKVMNFTTVKRIPVYTPEQLTRVVNNQPSATIVG